MDLTAVLTYQNGSVVLLGCNQIARINQSKKAIIVNGHWHGGGGSGAEWTVWKKKGDSLYNKYYIDEVDGEYTVGKDDKYSSSYDSKQYNKIYNKYVKKAKKISKYKKYKLSDKKGFRIQ
jgi:hypothetical protein